MENVIQSQDLFTEHAKKRKMEEKSQVKREREKCWKWQNDCKWREGGGWMVKGMDELGEGRKQSKKRMCNMIK